MLNYSLIPPAPAAAGTGSAASLGSPTHASSPSSSSSSSSSSSVGGAGGVRGGDVISQEARISGLRSLQKLSESMQTGRPKLVDAAVDKDEQQGKAASTDSPTSLMESVSSARKQQHTKLRSKEKDERFEFSWREETAVTSGGGGRAENGTNYSHS
jgi:hypothetical protein